MSKDSRYNIWAQMIARCENPKSPWFFRYGGRGIVVCARWRDSFESFVEDMGPRPSVKHSVDRIDNDGSYEPGNVRWATKSEQARNRRPSKRLLDDESLRQIRCLKSLRVPVAWIASLYGVRRSYVHYFDYRHKVA